MIIVLNFIISLEVVVVVDSEGKSSPQYFVPQFFS